MVMSATHEKESAQIARAVNLPDGRRHLCGCFAGVNSYPPLRATAPSPVARKFFSPGAAREKFCDQRLEHSTWSMDPLRG